MQEMYRNLSILTKSDRYLLSSAKKPSADVTDFTGRLGLFWCFGSLRRSLSTEHGSPETLCQKPHIWSNIPCDSSPWGRICGDCFFRKMKVTRIKTIKRLSGEVCVRKKERKRPSKKWRYRRRPPKNVSSFVIARGQGKKRKKRRRKYWNASGLWPLFLVWHCDS